MNQSNQSTVTDTLIPYNSPVVSRGANPELQITTLGLSIVIALVVMYVINRYDK